MNRKFYITLFLFLQKRKPVLKEKNKMNRKLFKGMEVNILHSSVSTIGWERRKGGALNKYREIQKGEGDK